MMDQEQALSGPNARPELSFVIPLLNEEGTLKELYEEIRRQCDGLSRRFEIIFVNDGSTDQSGDIVDALAGDDPRVGVIHFRRNFGKAAALHAGFREVRGDIVFTMDADLQDDPAEIRNFLDKLDEGYDLVSGYKRKRQDSIRKVVASRIFNFVVSRTSGIKLHDFNCGFKAYRRNLLQEISLHGELHRYVPVLAHWRGFEVSEIVVKHHSRRAGVSKYGIERLLKGFLDLLTVLLMTRFQSSPLHLFGFVGVLLSFLGFCCLSYLSVLWAIGDAPIGNRPLLTLGLLLVVVGVQLVSTGLIAEMVRSRDGGAERYSIRDARLPQGETHGERPNRTDDRSESQA